MRAYRTVSAPVRVTACVLVCVVALAAGASAGYTPASPNQRTYVVRSGDNLTVIARRYGTSIAELSRVNRLNPQAPLLAGKQLLIPRDRVNPNELAPMFSRWAAANKVPLDLLLATTWLESGWQNDVVSSTGAVGIGQLMPDAVDFIRDVLIGNHGLDVHVPEHNIRMSARYLRWLLERANGDPKLALAGYYQGFRSVAARGMLPETKAYVAGVLALRSRFRDGSFWKRG